MVASVEERAERRYKENVEKGITADLELLKKEIAERDYKDSHRAVSPLKPAADAIHLTQRVLALQKLWPLLKKSKKTS